MEQPHSYIPRPVTIVVSSEKEEDYVRQLQTAKKAAKKAEEALTASKGTERKLTQQLRVEQVENGKRRKLADLTNRSLTEQLQTATHVMSSPPPSLPRPAGAERLLSVCLLAVYRCKP
jgi:septal ring factor EnvC (AmiA/AmiB activator)